MRLRVNQDFNLLGAVAAMVIPSDVARYAYRQGLFAIAQSGEDLVIFNDDKFRPKGLMKDDGADYRQGVGF